MFKTEKLRESNGRFCTKERYVSEKISRENKVLRMERDKYLRAYLMLADENTRLRRELASIKDRIKTLV